MHTNFFTMNKLINNTPHQTQKHNMIINKFEALCQEWEKRMPGGHQGLRLRCNRKDYWSSMSKNIHK